jgi:hypothetical protein
MLASNNRFLLAYGVGYVDGRDNYESAVIGGTCTKID